MHCRFCRLYAHNVMKLYKYDLMNKLSKASFTKARQWIESNARPLEKTIFRYHFGNGNVKSVLVELKSFQNSDGGFGNAIEPDLRTSASSALGTTLAFQTLRLIGIENSDDLIDSAIEYLLKTYNQDSISWRIIPHEAKESPHAPWWNQQGRDDHFEGFHLNPTAEILGYLYDYKYIAGQDLIEKLTARVIDELEKLTEIEMHDFLCCKRLMESSGLNQTHKQKIQQELFRLADTCMVKDSSEWLGYGLKPIQIVDSPQSPFLQQFKSLVKENLEYELESQNEDGVWTPSWDWGDSFPEVWEKAKIEWTGIITLDRLLLLDRFERIDT